MHSFPFFHHGMWWYTYFNAVRLCVIHASTCFSEPGVHLFKDVWHVSLDSKHLPLDNKHRASEVIQSLTGPHRLCLTHDKLVFVRTTPSGSIECSRDSVIEMPLTSLRKFGLDSDSFFVIFSGRQSGLGENVDGQIIMTPEDEAMTTDIHCRILETTHHLLHDPGVYEYDSRNRTNSSGSNSGRRNNPPPSKIGMGKAAPKPFVGSSNGNLNAKQRTRCSSLPAADVYNLQELRLRAGSEGEYSMKRPMKHHHRTRGSMSPALHNCRNGYTNRVQHFPVSHSHTTSLPGSCNSSSFSSTEFINSDHDYVSAQPNSSPGHSDVSSSDEFIYGHSPHNLYPSRRGMHYRCPTPESRELLSVSGHSTHRCPYNHMADNYFSMSTPAPPPPNIDPPSLTSAVAVATSAKRNSVASHSDTHSRTHSFDDSISCGSSSLSASPYLSTMSSLHNGLPSAVKSSTQPIAMVNPNCSTQSISCSSSLKSSNVTSSFNDDYEVMCPDKSRGKLSKSSNIASSYSDDYEAMTPDKIKNKVLYHSNSSCSCPDIEFPFHLRKNTNYSIYENNC